MAGEDRWVNSEHCFFDFHVLYKKKNCGIKVCLFFLVRGFFLELLSFHFSHAFPLALRDKRKMCFVLLFCFFIRYSQCFTSLSLYCVLYILWYCSVVTSVVCWCIFFLFQLCRIYNEKTQENQSQHCILCVFIPIPETGSCFGISLPWSLFFFYHKLN